MADENGWGKGGLLFYTTSENVKCYNIFGKQPGNI